VFGEVLAVLLDFADVGFAVAGVGGDGVEDPDRGSTPLTNDRFGPRIGAMTATCPRPRNLCPLKPVGGTETTILRLGDLPTPTPLKA